jgi:hypothetical protein
VSDGAAGCFLYDDWVQKLHLLVHAVLTCCGSCQCGLAGAQTWSGLSCGLLRAHPWLAACGHKQMPWAVLVDTDMWRSARASLLCSGFGEAAGELHVLVLAPWLGADCKHTDSVLIEVGRFHVKSVVHRACALGSWLATYRGSASLPPAASVRLRSGRELP